MLLLYHETQDVQITWFLQSDVQSMLEKQLAVIGTDIMAKFKYQGSNTRGQFAREVWQKLNSTGRWHAVQDTYLQDYIRFECYAPSSVRLLNSLSENMKGYLRPLPRVIKYASAVYSWLWKVFEIAHLSLSCCK